MRYCYSFVFVLLAITASFADCPTRLYVNNQATGTNDGSSWENAFVKLSSAMQTAQTCPDLEIWIAKGKYFPQDSLYKISGDREVEYEGQIYVIPGDSIYFRPIHNYGVKIYGGFNGDETSINDRDLSLNETIISADIDGDDVYYEGDEIPYYLEGKPITEPLNYSNNLRSFLNQNDTVYSQVILDGFTLQGFAGTAISIGSGWTFDILLTYLDDVELTNLNVVNNPNDSASALSPIIEIGGADLHVKSSTFKYNQTTTLEVYNSHLDLSNSVFIQNFATGKNNVFTCLDHTDGNIVKIDSCLFEKNGGRVYRASNDSTLFINCDFLNNYKIMYGNSQTSSKKVSFDKCRFRVEKSFMTNFPITNSLVFYTQYYQVPPPEFSILQITNSEFYGPLVGNEREYDEHTYYTPTSMYIDGDISLELYNNSFTYYNTDFDFYEYYTRLESALSFTRIPPIRQYGGTAEIYNNIFNIVDTVMYPIMFDTALG